VQRLANNDFMHFIFLDQAPKRVDIGFNIFSPDSGPPLGRQEQGIADGNADGFIAHVESHNPHILMIQPEVRRAIMKEHLRLGGPS